MRQQSQNKKTGFVMAAIAALALTFGPGIAEAGGYKNKYHGKHHSSHQGKHYKRYNKHNDDAAIVLGALGVLGWAFHSDGHRYNKHYISQSRRHYRRHNRRHWKHASNYDRGYQGSCHPVKKRGYWHGNRAKIGGTACVDAYGNRYVVKGSRYLIKYLY